MRNGTNFVCSGKLSVVADLMHRMLLVHSGKKGYRMNLSLRAGHGTGRDPRRPSRMARLKLIERVQPEDFRSRVSTPEP